MTACIWKATVEEEYMGWGGGVEGEGGRVLGRGEREERGESLVRM